MATKQVRVCDRCGGPNAETVVILIGALSKREDLCPPCRSPIQEQWEKMPAPAESRATRRLAVVSMDEVRKAARASRRPQTGS